jgi:protein KIBRA
VSLADFGPESVSVKWYNILSFRFMQPPSDMTSTNSDALPLTQLSVGNTDIGKEIQTTVNCQDEERSNNNQGSEVSVFSKQVASVKEESSDDSTVISSQTSTLTRNQGTVMLSRVGYFSDPLNSPICCLASHWLFCYLQCRSSTLQTFSSGR